MKIRFIIATILLTAFFSKAEAVPDSLYQGTPVTIAYFSDYFTHPGIKVGVEYPLKRKFKVTVRRDSTLKIKEKQLFWSVNGIIYRHKGYNTGFIINGEIGKRKIRNRGFYTDFFVGWGYIRTFLPGKTYKANDDGTFSRSYLAGQNGIIPSIGFSLGKNYTLNKKIPIAWFVKQSFTFQQPYNSSIAFRWCFETGVTYWFNFKKIVFL